MTIQKFLFVFIIVLVSFNLIGQNKADNLKFKDQLQPLSDENIFKTDGYYNWCSSIVKGDDSKYHLFYSRWEKKYSFFGWLTHSEVAHAISKKPTGSWEYKETVLKGHGKEHWDAITIHNPKIKYFEGKYYLYYCSTNLGDKDYTEKELIETAHVGYSHPIFMDIPPLHFFFPYPAFLLRREL